MLEALGPQPGRKIAYYGRRPSIERWRRPGRVCLEGELTIWYGDDAEPVTSARMTVFQLAVRMRSRYANLTDSPPECSGFQLTRADTAMTISHSPRCLAKSALSRSPPEVRYVDLISLDIPGISTANATPSRC